MEKTGAYIKDKDRKKWPISMAQDILVPMVMQANGENPFTYLAARFREDIATRRENFTRDSLRIMPKTAAITISGFTSLIITCLMPSKSTGTVRG